MIVRVQNVFLVFRVARDVDLGNALRRDAVQIIERIETVISRGDVDVIDVEQNSAIGPLHDFREKLPFGHFRNMKFRVAADVFHAIGTSRKSRASRILRAVTFAAAKVYGIGSRSCV